MDIPEIIERLDTELKADPYGTAVAVIREVLEYVLDDGVSGAMNEHEFSTLDKLAKLLGELDPAAAPEPRVG